MCPDDFCQRLLESEFFVETAADERLVGREPERLGGGEFGNRVPGGVLKIFVERVGMLLKRVEGALGGQFFLAPLREGDEGGRVVIFWRFDDIAVEQVSKKKELTGLVDKCKENPDGVFASAK